VRTGSADPAARSRRLPLPFTPGLWSETILNRRVREDEIAFAILEDRQASLLYCGLSSLDDETLRAIAQDRKTLQILYKQHAGVLAAFGAVLRVRDGAVQVPGQDEGRPLWKRWRSSRSRRRRRSCWRCWR